MKRPNMIFAPKVSAGYLVTFLPAIAIYYLVDNKLQRIQAVELPDRVGLVVGCQLL